MNQTHFTSLGKWVIPKYLGWDLSYLAQVLSSRRICMGPLSVLQANGHRFWVVPFVFGGHIVGYAGGQSAKLRVVGLWFEEDMGDHSSF